jgi:hypothetical protein
MLFPRGSAVHSNMVFTHCQGGKKIVCTGYAPVLAVSPPTVRTLQMFLYNSLVDDAQWCLWHIDIPEDDWKQITEDISNRVLVKNVCEPTPCLWPK